MLKLLNYKIVITHVEEICAENFVRVMSDFGLVREVNNLLQTVSEKKQIVKKELDFYIEEA